jgi:hypothetical protein
MKTVKARSGRSFLAFLDGLPADRAKAVSRVRDVVLEHLPSGYVEVVQNNMLVYQVPLERYPDTYNGQPLWYAALAAPKSYLTLHLMAVYGSAKLAKDVADGFRAAGKTLNIGKACIRFHKADDLALDVIGKVVAAVPLDTWVEIAKAARRRR